MNEPEKKIFVPVAEEQELPTDPKAYQEYLLLSQVREDEIEAGETVGEE